MMPKDGHVFDDQGREVPISIKSITPPVLHLGGATCPIANRLFNRLGRSTNSKIRDDIVAAARIREKATGSERERAGNTLDMLVRVLELHEMSCIREAESSSKARRRAS